MLLSTGLVIQQNGRLAIYQQNKNSNKKEILSHTVYEV